MFGNVLAVTFLSRLLFFICSKKKTNPNPTPKINKKPKTQTTKKSQPNLHHAAGFAVMENFAALFLKYLKPVGKVQVTVLAA